MIHMTFFDMKLTRQRRRRAHPPSMPEPVVRKGHCVACSRPAAHAACRCPYCGEPVWHPRLWHTARWCVLLVPPAWMLGAVFLMSASPGWTTIFSCLRGMQPLPAWLAATALGLLALPTDTDDSVSGTPCALRRRQFETVFGGIVQALYAVTGAVMLATSADRFIPALFLDLPLFAGAALLPFFLRIPWPRQVASSILAAAALSIL